MYRPVPSGAADAGTAGRPFHTIRSCLHIMPTNAHRTRRNVDRLAGFAEKPTEKPTERCSVGVSFKKPTETDRLFGEKPKKRPSHFLLSVHNPALNTLPWPSFENIVCERSPDRMVSGSSTVAVG